MYHIFFEDSYPYCMTNNDHSGTYIKFLNLGDNFFSLYSCADNLYCLGSSLLATATFEYSYDIFFWIRIYELCPPPLRKYQISKIELYNQNKSCHTTCKDFKNVFNVQFRIFKFQIFKFRIFYSKFSDSKCLNSEFSNSELSNSEFSNSKFLNSKFSNSEFSYSEFSNMDTSNSEFSILEVSNSKFSNS